MDIDNILSIIREKSFSKNDLDKLFEVITKNNSFLKASTISPIEYYLQISAKLELVSLALIADKLCTSQRTLCRRLKKDNTNFLQLVDNERNNRCKQLFDTNILNGVVISHALAYSDPTYFYKKFEMWTGIRFKEAKSLLAENPGNIVQIFNLQDEYVNIEL
jgi:AraC-like DNA-binding protein